MRKTKLNTIGHRFASQLPLTVAREPHPAHRLFLAPILLLVMSAASQAGEWAVRLDPATSQIAFTLGATLHSIEGSARLSEGQLRFDPESRTLTGRVVIDNRSLESGNAKRDRKMHADILESERFPEITLTLTGFSGDFAASGKSTLNLFGQVTIHGASHKVDLPVEIEVDGEALAIHLELKIPFVEWGMEDPSTFVLRVAKTVEIEVNARGTLTAVPTKSDSDLDTDLDTE